MAEGERGRKRCDVSPKGTDKSQWQSEVIMIQLQGCEILAVSIVSNPAMLKCRERLRAGIKPHCDSQSGLHPSLTSHVLVTLHNKWCVKSTWQSSHLHRLPAPLSVLGVVGEPPHVHVRFDDLRPQDEVLLILPCGDGLHAAVETERLGTQLHTWNMHADKFIAQASM